MTEPPEDEPQVYRPMPPPMVKPIVIWSRTRGGVTSYSRWGRIVASVLLTVVPLWFFLRAGAFGLLGVLLWVFVILPKVLRDIWKRERIVVLPVDRDSPWKDT